MTFASTRMASDRLAGIYNFPPPGVILHLDAENITGLTDGDDVVTWPDVSDAGNDATQATAARRPIWKESIVNGLAVVRYDFIGDEHFTLPNLYSGVGSGEIFAVLKQNNDPTTNSGASGLWTFGSTTEATHYPFTDSKVYAGFGSTTRFTCGDPVADLASWHILNIHSVGSDWELRINGVPLFSSASNVVGWDASPKLGMSRSTSFTFDGDMAAVVAFSRVLEAKERSRVHDYLSSRYGISL